MEQEKSCGAVVFRKKGGEYQVLLIRHVNGGHWAFPKGHVENAETESETALREIKEETGLDVSLDTGFRSVTTYSPAPGVTKDVVYFIASASNEGLLPQKEEVQSAGWYSLEEAEKLITYENDRRLFESAVSYRKENGGRKGES